MARGTKIYDQEAETDKVNMTTWIILALIAAAIGHAIWVDSHLDDCRVVPNDQGGKILVCE